MADLSILAGATSQSIMVDLYVLTTGAAQTGLVFNSSGLLAYYSFAGANGTATAITLATLAAVNSAYSSGGFKEIDATNMPGLYRLDLPNAALAGSKGRQVVVTLTGFSGMATTHKFLELTGWDNQDGVRGGMTALPNAAASGVGGLLTAPTTANVGLADLSRILGTALTETAGLLAGGFKKFFNVSSPTGTLNSIPDAVAGATGGLFIAGTNAATTVTTALTTTFTGNLTGSVGSVTGAVGSVAAGGIAAASFAAGAIDATAIAANAIGASELAADAVTEIADGILDRDMSVGTDSGSTTFRTPRQALRFLRNKWSIAAGTLTVCKEDDSTSSWTGTVSTDAAAVPIIGNDPAG